MEVFAAFETWHLGDGNYPPLGVGELVNLSFELQSDELQRPDAAALLECRHLGEARYQFVGSVLRVYGDGTNGDRIVLVEAGQFRFYIYNAKANEFSQGDLISGNGTLLFDHYIWVEFLSSYPEPPNLFYTLRVNQIWRYRIPERFITRSAHGVVGCPAWVAPAEFGPNDVAKVDLVSDEDFAYYVIQFSDQDIPSEPVARTFLS